MQHILTWNVPRPGHHNKTKLSNSLVSKDWQFRTRSCHTHDAKQVRDAFNKQGRQGLERSEKKSHFFQITLRCFCAKWTIINNCRSINLSKWFMMAFRLGQYSFTLIKRYTATTACVNCDVTSCWSAKENSKGNIFLEQFSLEFLLITVKQWITTNQ